LFLCGFFVWVGGGGGGGGGAQVTVRACLTVGLFYPVCTQQSNCGST
jgi:hypothetical protein